MSTESQRLIAKDRRVKLARIMVDEGFKVKQTEVAKKLNVSGSDISRDLRHPDYLEALNEIQDDWHHQVNHKARRFLELVISEGFKAMRQDTPPLDVIESDEVFDWQAARNKAIDRAIDAMKFKLSTGDPRFSTKIEHMHKEVAAPADEPELVEILTRSIDEKIATATALVPLDIKEAKGNGKE